MKNKHSLDRGFSKELYRDIAFGNNVHANDPSIAEALLFSLLSNSLDSFRNESFTPQSSLYMFFLHLQSRINADGNLKLAAESLDRIIKNVTEYKAEGDALESFFEEWLKFRLLLRGDAPISLATLLGLPSVSFPGVGNHLKSMLKTTISPDGIISTAEPYRMVHGCQNRSEDNDAAFAKELDGITVSEDFPVKLLW